MVHPPSARVNDVRTLVTQYGTKVGEVQTLLDRFQPPYFRVVTSKRDECRTFYSPRDMRRWLEMCKLSFAL